MNDPPDLYRRRNPVAEMTRSAMAALLGPEFDAFLFAPVGEERNGGLLSVLSALARLDVDPWKEAAELAQMPILAAKQRLTSLLAALPDAPVAWLAPATIADRLVRLLPRGDGASAASRERLLGADPAPNSRTVANMILINLLVMAGMMCAQWALAGLQPPASASSVHAPVSRTAGPQALPPGQAQ
jgi:hypothetical protein